MWMDVTIRVNLEPAEPEPDTPEPERSIMDDCEDAIQGKLDGATVAHNGVPYRLEVTDVDAREASTV